MLNLTIHWFRRDLRLDDNTALIAAAQSSDFLIPLFIVDDTLIRTSRVRGGTRLGFMVACLRALDEELRERGSRLIVRRGEHAVVLYDLVQQTGAARLTFNRDYSPYARQRDRRVNSMLRAAGITVDTYPDLVMHEFEEVLTESGTPYQVYTPYKRRWLTLPKPAPQALEANLPPLPIGLDTGTIPTAADLGGASVAQPITQAGEKIALNLLEDFCTQKLARYSERRNMLAEEGTSRLSPHLRWGTISIRRCYAAARQAGRGAEAWINELIWRDFYHMVLAFHPTVISRSFRPQYDRIQWENNEAFFAAWCAGYTGYPVVDAAMRQLNLTGWMHNRARMIVASFLCKDLLVDWRWGERYFMQKLLDGDTSANNGGWQWAAGSGTDAAPYFRIFNPTEQGKKFDPKGDYVRRWLPELASVPAALIHSPEKIRDDERRQLDYPPPIVQHAVQRQKALVMYRIVKA